MRRVENGMLILGEESKRTPWERFARNQRRAQLLARGKGFRAGVQRFKSHEDLHEWKLKNRVV
jgi:hypothetical protein